jgi:hypothetical protein
MNTLNSRYKVLRNKDLEALRVKIRTPNIQGAALSTGSLKPGLTKIQQKRGQPP